MNDFTASNDYVVSVVHENRVVLHNQDGENTLSPDFVRVNDALDGHDMQALREFFQAEADEHLGRWRDPEDSVFSVYSGGAWDGIFSPIRVVAETNGASWLLDRDDHEPNVPPKVLAVARRFFDAHPEPKPWHDAEPGEGWLLTIDGRECAAVALADPNGVFGGVKFETAEHGLFGRLATAITAGRRFWPEVSS